MSEASYVTELRDAAPIAPERLRELVLTLPPPKPRVSLPVRPMLPAALGVVLAVGVGAAIIGGISSSPKGRETNAASSSDRAFRALQIPAPKPSEAQSGQRGFAPTLTAKSRLQRQDVSMSLRVKDLSGATQHAVRTTRRLGGFVEGADYSTDTKTGNSRLALRVPVANLQKAIANFTNLGTILSQHISVADLQGGLDRLDARIANARHAGHRRTVARLERRRDALVREGTYARVSLQLTTAKPVAKNVVPGRFDRFLDTSGDILGKEAIAVLYALVLIGPFVLIAALLLLAERTRRRRADHRLLEETG